MLEQDSMKTSVKQVLLLIPALLGVFSVPGWPQSAAVDPTGTLDFGGKFHYYAVHTFSLATIGGSAVSAGIVMIDPPGHYPRDWKDGGEAFGRNLGDGVAVTGTLFTGKFLAGAALGEDPRYFPSHSANPATRIAHALAFTFIDKSDHGASRLALSNFAGAAAAGFVGEAYLPNGFNDNTHAYQRCFIAFGLLGLNNILSEFRPELRGMAHRMHLIRNP